jgi:hypothetical protein
VVWVECFGSSIGEIMIQQGLLDRERHTFVDLIEGKILESRISRKRGTTIRCSPKL